ncbi:MAG: ATP-dependent RNA helicase, partial [bacterium]
QVVQFLGRQTRRRRRGGGAIGFGQRGHGDERRQGVGDDSDGFSRRRRGKVTSGRLGQRRQRLLLAGSRHDDGGGG